MKGQAALSPEDVIRVAYFVHVMGLTQHDAATILNINQGRIAEACLAVMHTATNVREIYQAAITAKRPPDDEGGA